MNGTLSIAHIADGRTPVHFKWLEISLPSAFKLVFREEKASPGGLFLLLQHPFLPRLPSQGKNTLSFQRQTHHQEACGFSKKC